MKKLTAKQRAKIYLSAFVYYSKYETNKSIDFMMDGACLYLLKKAKLIDCFTSEATDCFPEFALFEPKNKCYGTWWWSPRFNEDFGSPAIDRIIALLFCYEMALNP